MKGGIKNGGGGANGGKVPAPVGAPAVVVEVLAGVAVLLAVAVENNIDQQNLLVKIKLKDLLDVVEILALVNKVVIIIM